MSFWTIDFETEAIVRGSPAPPRPVGVAIKKNDENARYYAFAHSSENNSTFEFVDNLLNELVNSNQTLIFHNAKFDINVAMCHFGTKFPIIYHDTMFMAFLNNPREKSLSLKPLADKYLDMPPDEQTELKNWILENVKGSRESSWGAHIAEAPGKLVGRYAIGDVDRTFKLFSFFIDAIMEKSA